MKTPPGVRLHALPSRNRLPARRSWLPAALVALAALALVLLTVDFGTAASVNRSGVETLRNIVDCPECAAGSNLQFVGRQDAHLRAIDLAAHAGAAGATMQALDEASAPASGVAAVAAAQIFFSRGQENTGQALMDRMPGSWAWAYTRARSAELRQEWDAVSLWAERAMKVDPSLSADKVDLYRLACSMRRHFGQYDLALATCQSYLRVASQYLRPYTETGFLYLQMGRFQEGLDVLNAGLATGASASAWHYYLLGRAEEGLAHTATAQTWYEKSLAVDPGFAASNLSLGLLLAKTAGQEVARRYLSIAAQSSETYYSDLAKEALRRFAAETPEVNKKVTPEQ